MSTGVESDAVNAGAAVPNSGTARSLSLLDYMRNSHADEIPRSAAQVVNDSDLILGGTIVTVTEGRTVDFADGPSHPIPMAVLEIRTTERVKGEAGPSVFFEYIRGGASAPMLRQHLPEEEFLFLLRQSRNWDSATYKSDDRNRGLPEGATLYQLTSQRGLLMEADGRVTQALDPSEEMLFTGATLDAIVDEIQELMMARSSDAGAP